MVTHSLLSLELQLEVGPVSHDSIFNITQQGMAINTTFNLMYT